MCQWRYEVHLTDDWDEELASFPFAGGVRPAEEARDAVLKRVRRQVAGYVNAHPQAREDIRIVEMSCNGPQRTIYPYRQGAYGVELRLDIGGWEFLPGEEEQLPLADLPEAPGVTAPGPASRPSSLAASDSRESYEKEAEDAEEAVVVLRDGKRIGTFKDSQGAKAAIAAWPPEERRGVVAHLVDLHGETLERVWPLEKFLRPEGDGFAKVRDYFDSFLHYPRELAEALERLKTWARITSQDIEGGGRANDELVELRASTLYSLRHSLRELESAEGKLLVGRDDSWAPYPTKAVSTFTEAQAEVARLEEEGHQPAVYTIEGGQAGKRLYPVSPTPYAVWSMGTANLIGEFATADEAIACAKEDPDDLVAFLEEDGRATAVYDPNGLVALSTSERRERLRGLGRWPAPAPGSPSGAEEGR